MFTTRIDSGELEAIILVHQTPTFYIIPKQDSWLPVIIVSITELFKDFTSIYCFIYGFSSLITIERQFIIGIMLIFYGKHERITHTNGYVGFSHSVQISLEIDKFLKVGMVTREREHQCSPASLLSDETSDHRIKVGERHCPSGFTSGIVDLSTSRSELGKVDSNPSTITECTSQLSSSLKN